MIRSLARRASAAIAVMLPRSSRPRGEAFGTAPPEAPATTADAAPERAELPDFTVRLVADRDVVGDYPGAVSARFRRIGYGGGISEDTGILAVVPVDDAIVKRHWVADPARGTLFANHDYMVQLNPWPAAADGLHAVTVAASEVVRLDGTVIVVGGAWDRNYYHWLLNWLPRLAIVRMLAPHLEDDPTVRILIDEHDAGAPFADFLALMGVDPTRIIWANPGTVHHVRTAIAVSFPIDYFPDVLARLAADVKRDLPPAPHDAPKRIWIDRQGIGGPKRRIANHAAILPVLQAHGFVPVRLEALPLAEQIALFASAEAVAGVNGAGLANMIFSPADCRVVCIERLVMRRLRLDAMFSGLAAACGLGCEIVHARSQREPGGGFSRSLEQRHNQDLIVDPAALDRALARAVRR